MTVSLGEILRQAEINAFDTSPARCADAQAAQLRARPRMLFNHERPSAEILQEVSTASRMRLNAVCQHLEIFDTLGMRRGMAALHGLDEGGDGEIVFVGPGAITRRVIREIATWAFIDNGLRRLTARVRSDVPSARDYARRLGFALEGCQQNFFEPGVHAYLWGISRERAAMRWLGIPPHHWGNALASTSETV